MKWRFDHMPVLLTASTLAMIGLVLFQYKWINHSQELYDEVFHQRACMALCSTLEEYGEGAICSNEACATACGIPQVSEEISPAKKDLVNNQHFHTDLRKTLDFYNIDLSYEMSQSQEDPGKHASQTPACVVSLPSHDTSEEASFIALDFPDMQSYMMDKMKFMIGASVIILLFTAIVLLFANWWLIKQKRLLRTNVEMYNNMAHEFRTPLTNINLAAGLMHQGPEGGDQKLLDIIKRENGKLMQQVERILHLARLDNGEYDLKKESLPLRYLLQNVLDELQIQIEERNAEVRIDGIPDNLDIYGDQQHLANVFRNLIDNALKYSTHHPVISLTATEEDKNVIISVEDNGIGIPSSQSRLIFEKFQRIHQGNLHEQKGFGLGLAYVKKIIELHQGRIEVASEVNQGSCFNVYLPKYS
jgi:signal transduction histidine kinase